MIRKCALTFGAIVLASGCGGSSDHRSSAAESPSTDVSTSAPDTASATPDLSSPIPEPTPTTQEPVEETPTEESATSDAPDTWSGGDTTDDGDQSAGDGDQDCGSLAGSGTFTDPLQLGVVDGLVTARDCAPLTSGSPFNVRYFSFTLSGAPGTDAHAGASFTLTQDALGPVYPAIVQPNGWVLKHSLGSGYWTGTEPDFTGRYQQISDLASGTYILRTEKLDSPLHSLSTPSYDVVVDPGY
ncbi:hypothetical protein [Streptomyces diastatochromogenes]|uniref:hypothetical protein n=1 Tax=Streptomyces diastatochromogenes TaxID=42236 RepID=UPI00117BEA4E|nr:hypothetical protein [Streptomyces diastatochromogenes]MCZ0985723.1 hypothetical protein [Streptomyces diastatochromogenes]